MAILNEAQERAVEEHFIRRSAAEQMMVASRLAPATGKQAEIMMAMRDALRGDITLEAFLELFDGRIPPQLRELVSSVVATCSRAHSPVAMAASSGGVIIRVVDDCKITFVTDDDAVFVVMELAAKYADHPPERIIAIQPGTGLISTRSLPKPVRNTIQLGLRRSLSVDAEAIEVLTDPLSKLYLN